MKNKKESSTSEKRPFTAQFIRDFKATTGLDLGRNDYAFEYPTAATVVGGEEVLERAIRLGWIKGKRQGKVILFDFRDLFAVGERLDPRGAYDLVFARPAAFSSSDEVEKTLAKKSRRNG